MSLSVENESLNVHVKNMDCQYFNEEVKLTSQEFTALVEVISANFE